MTGITAKLAAATLVALPLLTALDYHRPARGPREDLLVSAPWLKQHIKDKDLVLLHIGERAEYNIAHIPGARFVGLDDISAPQGADHATSEVLELPKPEVLRARLEALGISDRSRIIVYYGKDWVSPTTRVIFTLDWIGLGARTSMLDGGMKNWELAGGAVSAEPPVIKPGKLSVKPARALVVDANWVHANAGKPGYALVDARSKGSYDGVQAGMVKAGHIPGARNLPFGKVANDSLRILPAPALRALFTEAGIKPGDTIVGYCHIGQYATAVLFAARTLGHRVLLYDGSFHDWEKRDLPVQK